jgi:hypothetical protein
VKKRECTPLEAFDSAHDLIVLLKQRKAAETAATSIDKKIRKLDATVWRHYNDIMKGTCSVAAYKHMFRAMDERIPLEQALETQKKAMLLVDEKIRHRKFALDRILKNIDAYVGTSNSNIEENLR